MHGHNTRPAAVAASAGEAEGQHLFSGRTRFSLVSAMTSMLALGLPLAHVVAMVSSNAARMLGMPEDVGRLRVGGTADISVLSDSRGRWILGDDEGAQIETSRLLQPLFCLRAGERFDATASILPILKAA
jgi:dihydroorotase